MESNTIYEIEKAKALKEFSKIESNAAKKQFVEIKIDKIDTGYRAPKNNDQANTLRLQGNKYFGSRSFVKAMEMYNQSICFAETNSEALGIGYANRSATYFEWQKYELCLANIELAKQNGYPQRLMSKLNKRNNDCEIALHITGDDDDNEDEPLLPVLSFPPHSNVPFVANCLELRENNKFGRHIVTKIDISVGQVVAIEDSFCVILDPMFKYQRCANCLRENYFNLIPCKRCTATMFCQNCEVEAEQRFHQIECPIIDFISVVLAEEYIVHEAIRATICTINSFRDIDSLRTLIQDSDMEIGNVFSLNNYNDGPLTERRYKAIHVLQTNQIKQDESELYDLAALSSVIYNSLIKETPLKKLLKTDADKGVLMELIFRHIQIFQTSCIPFVDIVGLVPSYGHGLFAFHGLLNHSCQPNCLTVCFSRRSALFVRRPIKAGEQLFISYGIDHVTKNVADRQGHLLTHFKFKCNCIACENGNYYDIMVHEPKDNVPSLLNSIDFLFIMAASNRTYILNNLQRYINYINNYDNHYPCRQLSAADGCLLASLHVLYSETSFRNH